MERCSVEEASQSVARRVRAAARTADVVAAPAASEAVRVEVAGRGRAGDIVSFGPRKARDSVGLRGRE
jgi:hypothetical protein